MGHGATGAAGEYNAVCDPSKLTERACEGAPDLAIEVVSPSSQRLDYLRKALLYESAGVREYWMADPASRCTTIYRYAAGSMAPTTVPFDEPARVGIFPDLEIVVGALLA